MAETQAMIFKTLVEISDGLSVHPCRMDTIWWRENLWLVPKWQLSKTEGNRQPTRLVRPQLFSFEQVPAMQAGENYYLTCVIPKTILDGQIVSEGPIIFDIVEAPEIEFPIPKT